MHQHASEYFQVLIRTRFLKKRWTVCTFLIALFSRKNATCSTFVRYIKVYNKKLHIDLKGMNEAAPWVVIAHLLLCFFPSLRANLMTPVFFYSTFTTQYSTPAPYIDLSPILQACFLLECLFKYAFFTYLRRKIMNEPLKPLSDRTTYNLAAVTDLDRASGLGNQTWRSLFRRGQITVCFFPARTRCFWSYKFSSFNL